MNEQPRRRSLGEVALIDALDACDAAQEVVAAIMLSARGILDASDRKGMMCLAEILVDQSDAWADHIRTAQRHLGFQEGGSR